MTRGFCPYTQWAQLVPGEKWGGGELFYLLFYRPYMCLVTHRTLQLFLICYMDKTFKLLCFVLAITICSKCTTFDQLFLRKFIKTDARAGGVKQLLYMHMHYAMHTRCHDLLCMAVFCVCVCVFIH